MGLLDFLNRTKIKQFSDGKLEYEVNKVGSIEVPDRLTDNNAFVLANTVAEIFFPIDFLADRASKLRFYIADKAGTEVVNTELNRFITDINPLFSFSDLFYQAAQDALSRGDKEKAYEYFKKGDELYVQEQQARADQTKKTDFDARGKPKVKLSDIPKKEEIPPSSSDRSHQQAEQVKAEEPKQ